ncbi:hypothetical protein [Xanthomonas sacchari]|uniref:hypothetical protein n=1 Tax=Xanthomonas sacchari TaxID=56458 RepID=UPI0020C4CE94|nr:hypothetical protein [Xanthomonas sacchari]
MRPSIRFLALGIAASALAATAAPGSGQTRRQVEHGLLPAVVAQDQAGARLTLREQMRALHVPGGASSATSPSPSWARSRSAKRMGACWWSCARTRRTR